MNIVLSANALQIVTDMYEQWLVWLSVAEGSSTANLLEKSRWNLEDELFDTENLSLVATYIHGTGEHVAKSTRRDLMFVNDGYYFVATIDSTHSTTVSTTQPLTAQQAFDTLVNWCNKRWNVDPTGEEPQTPFFQLEMENLQNIWNASDLTTEQGRTLVVTELQRIMTPTTDTNLNAEEF